MNTSMIDLRKCRKGQRLLTKHGTILLYVGPTPEGHYYDHEVTYPNGSRGTRTHNGQAFRKNRQPEDEDVIKIL